jgi:hypothetical protein
MARLTEIHSEQRAERGTEGKRREEKRNGITSPLVNIELSYHIMQPTKHEHHNPDYVYPSYQTRLVCIDLA